MATVTFGAERDRGELRPCNRREAACSVAAWQCQWCGKGGTAREACAEEVGDYCEAFRATKGVVGRLSGATRDFYPKPTMAEQW